MIVPAAGLQPLPFTVLLDEGVRHFRRHFRRAFFPVAIPLALAQLVMTVLQTLWMTRMFELGSTETAEPTFRELFGPAAGFGCVAMPLLIATYFFSYIALGRLAVDAVVTGEPAAGRAWRFAFRLPVIGTQLLAGLFIGLSIVACCVGALYVVPALSFTLPVMVEEGRFGTAALSRSHELARYNPGRRFLAVPMVRVLVLLLVAAILTYVVSFAIQLPVALIQQWQFMRAAVEGAEEMVVPPAALWLNVPVGMLGSLVQTAVQLYAALGIALLFVDTRRRKEAPDLEAALSALEAESPSPPQAT